MEEEAKEEAISPEDSHKKVEYPIAIVKGHDNPSVTAFYSYLKGPEAAKVFQK